MKRQFLEEIKKKLIITEEKTHCHQISRRPIGKKFPSLGLLKGGKS